jgi:hypothetical protein
MFEILYSEYGKKGLAGQAGHQNITRPEYGGLAHNGIEGSFFRRVFERG